AKDRQELPEGGERNHRHLAENGRRSSRTVSTVIASAAKQSRAAGGTLDCFAALAMTKCELTERKTECAADDRRASPQFRSSGSTGIGATSMPSSISSRASSMDASP